MKVTLYKRPYGNTEVIDITNVYPEDAEWFENHSIKISMEDIGGDFVIYADTGKVDEDGEPDECIEIAQGRDCFETLKSLRMQCENN